MGPDIIEVKKERPFLRGIVTEKVELNCLSCSMEVRFGYVQLCVKRSHVICPSPSEIRNRNIT